MSNHHRLRSLDVFRGLTIVLMILVNSLGNESSYAWLDHAPWNGCTLADFVFPSFVFILGISLVLSLAKANAQGISSYELLPKILKRSLLIFCIGLMLNAFPNHFNFEHLRLLGVLQRIAICYFFAAVLYLYTSVRTQCMITAGILFGYWWMMTQFSAEHYTIDNNIAALVDQSFISPHHLYRPTYDPEGILSTFPALATALIGNLIGIWLHKAKTHLLRLKGLIFAGGIFIVLGYLWGIVFPINKTLWSSSYVCWTAGWSLWVLALCYWLIEIKNFTKWSQFFEIFGLNALLAFVLHVFFLKLQAWISIQSENQNPIKLKLFITHTLFDWTTPSNASLLYAISYVLLWFLVLKFFYDRKIFVKL